MKKALIFTALFFISLIAVFLMIGFFVVDLRINLLAITSSFLVNIIAATLLYKNKIFYYIAIISACCFVCVIFLLRLPYGITDGAHVQYQASIVNIFLIPIPLFFIATKLLSYCVRKINNRAE